MPHKDLEVRRQYRKKYYESHKEKLKERSRKWYKDNQERHKESGKQYWIKNQKQLIIINRKIAAKRRGIEFNLSIDDLEWPDICPALGIPILYGASLSQRQNSPSIDRKNPSEGYTKENCRIISYRANQIKNDATIEEMKKILDFMEK